MQRVPGWQMRKIPPVSWAQNYLLSRMWILNSLQEFVENKRLLVIRICSLPQQEKCHQLAQIHPLSKHKLPCLSDLSLPLPYQIWQSLYAPIDFDISPPEPWHILWYPATRTTSAVLPNYCWPSNKHKQCKDLLECNWDVVFIMTVLTGSSMMTPVLYWALKLSI